MADEKAEFRAALEEVRNGSPDAALRFIEEYGPHILRIARRKLDPRIQSKFDSQDFVQMVWVSFFRNPRQIRSFRDSDDLLRYLARLVRNKIYDEHRRRIISAKRNVNRERPLDPSDEPTARSDLTPSHFAIAREAWQKLIQGKPARDQRIVHLRLRGATFVEIAQQLGMNERSVRRIMERLLQSYQDRFDSLNTTKPKRDT